jgi:integrase
MHHFSPEQLATLIENVPARHRLMVLVGFWHGLRVTELINLTSRDIQHGYVKTVRLKGSRPTLQPYVLHLNDGKTESMLSEYSGLKELAKKPLDERLFPVTRFCLNKMMTRLNNKVLDLPKCHPHMLKHTCAHVMIDGGKTVPEIQKRLGHVRGDNTLRYLEVSEQQAAQGMGGLL